MKKIAVIVITHNGKQYLKECFESLAKQTYKNFDTYLLDNASTDGSSDFVREKFPWVEIIRFEKNYGFAKGYNLAVKKIGKNYKYIAFLNDDTKVDKKWLEELVKVIESDESIFAVGSKILFYDKPDIINHAGGKITIIGSGIDIGFGLKNSHKFNKKEYVGYVCGASMLIRREIYEILNGFDEDFFAYVEDVDICWRAWLMGYKVVYTPTSIVYHRYGGSWGKRFSYWRIYYTQRNRLINILKNFELKNVIIGICISIVYDIFRILIFLINKDFQNLKALFRANIDFIKEVRKYLKKRVYIQKYRKVSDKELFKKKLVVTLSYCLKEFNRLIIKNR